MLSFKSFQGVKLSSQQVPEVKVPIPSVPPGTGASMCGLCSHPVELSKGCRPDQGSGQGAPTTPLQGLTARSGGTGRLPKGAASLAEQAGTATRVSEGPGGVVSMEVKGPLLLLSPCSQAPTNLLLFHQELPSRNYSAHPTDEETEVLEQSKPRHPAKHTPPLLSTSRDPIPRNPQF